MKNIFIIIAAGLTLMTFVGLILSLIDGRPEVGLKMMVLLLPPAGICFFIVDRMTKKETQDNIKEFQDKKDDILEKF